jgi:hypothetical protein
MAIAVIRPLRVLCARNRSGTMASKAKMPPPRHVVGAHHEAGYLTVTAITSARSMSDTMPYKSATVALAPPAAIKLLQRV